MANGRIFRKNCDGTYVIVEITVEIRTYVISPPATTGKKPVRKPQHHVVVPRVDSPPARDQSRRRCAKLSCRRSSLTTHW